MLNGCQQPFKMLSHEPDPGSSARASRPFSADLRHWKEALPPLARHNGHRPCFSLGDLFAMALIKAMTDDAGVRIGALDAVSGSLFEQCGRRVMGRIGALDLGY